MSGTYQDGTNQAALTAMGMKSSAMKPCKNCGHSWEAHQDKYGCQSERGDRWVPGESIGGYVAMGPCGCEDFE
jgi:hypothetical protein